MWTPHLSPSALEKGSPTWGSGQEDERWRTMALIDRRTFIKAASGGAVVAAFSPFSAPWAYAGVAGRTDQYDAAVALAHANAALRVIKSTPGFSPPVASRFLAYMGVALYAAVAPGMPGYRPLAGLFPGFPEVPETPHAGLHWPTVANHAISTALASMVPAGSAAEDLIRATAVSQDRTDSLPAPLMQRSIRRGEMVGLATADWAEGDGGHNGYLKNFPAGYVSPVGPGLWEPTAPALQPIPLQPFWGENRTFVHTLAGVAPPPTYSTSPGSEFYDYANEVYLISQNLTADQTEIARFWADDPGTVTPPGHSISMTAQVLESEGASLAMAAETLLRVGCAVADAFIQCWHTKFIWNLVRPVTFVRALIDATWLPIVTTPPFPEYNSGHSTQSGAWAEVMTSLFGSGYEFTDHTHDVSGAKPRSFVSFREAAEEAALSRLFGGIHYAFSNDSGLTVGQSVGRAAAEVTLTR